MNALKSIEKKPEVSVIIVNYNDRLHLEDCLLSLEKNTQDINFELIVVDNNSSDGSQGFIEEHYPHIKLIRNEDNLGFARANNQGIRESKGEFILFLNTDTVIYPKTLETLLEEMKRDCQIGAIGPALLRGENVYQISFGEKVSFIQELLKKCFLNSYLKLKLKFRQHKREVNWLGGACLLTRKDILKDVGLFDENFFLYFEDIDLCFRIKQKGFKLIFFPQVRVLHKGGASTLRSKVFSRYEYRRSQLYFYRKHNSKLSLFLLHCYLWMNFSFLFLFRYFKKDLGSVSRGQFFQLLKENRETRSSKSRSQNSI